MLSEIEPKEFRRVFPLICKSLEGMIQKNFWFQIVWLIMCKVVMSHNHN